MNYDVQNKRSIEYPKKLSYKDNKIYGSYYHKNTKDNMYSVLIISNNENESISLNNDLKDSFIVDTLLSFDNALEYLNNKNYSVIFVIVDNLNSQGFKLISKLSKDSTLKSIPVVAVSIYPDKDIEYKAIKCGAVDFEYKTGNIELFICKVHNIILRQQTSLFAAKKNMYELQLSQQSQILWRAENDEQTGLLNRPAFIRHVKERIEKYPCDKYVLIAIEIQNLTIYNEIMGVSQGDKLICHIADIIRFNSKSKALFSRIRPETFLYLAINDEITPEELSYEINTWIDNNSTEYKVSVKFGVYIVDDISLNVSLMCDRVLLACNYKKDNFLKSIVYYDISMSKKLYEEQKLICDFYAGLKKDEFKIYIQPQYNYITNKLIGGEALVRWNHPNKGLLTPSAFLPVCEKNGLVTKLDLYVFEKVCIILQSFIKLYGKNICPLSVNLSRVDLYQTNICKTLCDIADKYNVPHNLICIEITESAFMEKPEYIIKVTDEIRSKNFNIHLDDFGSSYSSLNCLKDIKINVLKLDMNFLKDMENNDKSIKILSSIIRMANYISTPVIAEGVETKNQAEYLKCIGCMYMQGYYFSKPIPLDQYELIIKSNNISTITKECYTKYNYSTNIYNIIENPYFSLENDENACILIEQISNHIEVLRANEQFYNTINCTREDYLPYLVDFVSTIERQYQHIFYDLLNEALITRNTASGLLAFKVNNNSEIYLNTKVNYLRTTLNVNNFIITFDNKVDLSAINKIKLQNGTQYNFATNLQKTYEKYFDYDVKRFLNIYSDLCTCDSIVYNHLNSTFIYTDKIIRYDKSIKTVLNNKFDENIYNSISHNCYKKFYKFCYNAITKKENSSEIIDLLLKDGTLQKTRVNSYYFYNQNNLYERTLITIVNSDNSKKIPLFSNEMYMQILQNTQEGYAIYEISNTITHIYSSDKIYEILEIDKNSLQNESEKRIVYNMIPSHLLNSITNKPTVIPKYEYKTNDDKTKWFKIVCSLREKNKNSSILLISIIDITETVLLQNDINIKNEIYNRLCQVNNTIIIDINTKLNSISVSSNDFKQYSFLSTFQDVDDFCNSFREYISHESFDTFKDVIIRAFSSPCEGEADMHISFQHDMPQWYRLKYISIGEDKVYRLFARLDNINDLILSKNQIVKSSQIDNLTGLINKDSAITMISELMSNRYSSNLNAILFIDVDNFKSINDTYGHYEADIILHQIGLILKSNFKNSDIVARFGGDEFLVYMASAKDINHIENKADNIINSMSKLYSDKSIPVTVSIGIYVIEDSINSFSTAFVKADQALYVSKKCGRNCYTVYNKLDEDELILKRS